MEGGASRTFFSCGICDVFLKEGIYPDYFIGVSAGIAYGVSYISKQYGRNLEFTKKYMHKKKYMGMHHLLNPQKRCYYNLSFAFDEVPNRLVPFDYKTFAEFQGKCVAVVTNIHTGKAEYIEVPAYERHWETTIASCSLPILFPPAKLGSDLYLDGGLVDSIPYEQAVLEGCDKIIVLLTRPRRYQKGQEKGLGLIKALYKKYPKVVEAIERRPEQYNQSSQRLLELEKEGKVFVMAPEKELGVKRTEGRWERLEPTYKEGVRTAQKELPRLKHYLQD